MKNTWTQEKHDRLSYLNGLFGEGIASLSAIGELDELDREKEANLDEAKLIVSQIKPTQNKGTAMLTDELQAAIEQAIEKDLPQASR